MENSLLKKLAPELRIKIYTLTFAKQKPVEIAIATRNDKEKLLVNWDWREPHQLALTKTCKAIREESIGIWYAATTFVIYIDSAFDGPDVFSIFEQNVDRIDRNFSRPLFTLLNSINKNRLKHVNILVDCNVEVPSGSVSHNITETIRTILKITIGYPSVLRQCRAKFHLEFPGTQIEDKRVTIDCRLEEVSKSLQKAGEVLSGESYIKPEEKRRLHHVKQMFLAMVE